MPASFTPLSLARTGRQPSPLRRLAPLALAALLGCTASAALAQSGGRIVAQFGAPAVGVPVLGATFGVFSDVAINDDGQVAFLGVYVQGNNVLTGIWRDTSLVAREGQAAFGLPLATFASLEVKGPNWLSPTGEVAYVARLQGLGVTPSNQYALFSNTRLVHRATEIDQTSFAAAGTPAYRAVNDTLDTVIRRETQVLAQTGSPAGPSTNYDSVSLGNTRPTGQVLIHGATDSQQAARTGFINVGSTMVYRGSDPVLGLAPNTLVTEVVGAAMNAQGELGWVGNLNGGGRVVVGRGEKLLATGDAVPGMPAGTVLEAVGTSRPAVHVDDAGRTLWHADLIGPAFGSSIFGNAWMRDRTVIVRTGDSTPIEGALIGPFSAGPVAPGGQVLVSTVLTGPTVTPSEGLALFLADEHERVLVARRGYSFAGVELEAFFTGGTKTMGVNQHGQVAFLASSNFDDLDLVLAWTPALRWRSTSSGSWADAARWTLGLNPAAVHDVAIDPASSLTVTLGGAPVSVNSLMVGHGGGMATLRLDGGDLAITDGGLQLASRGILSGEGFIRAEVTNHGEVRPTNLVIDSRLVNHGIVRGSASDVARLNTELRNEASGQVRLGEGERLLLQEIGGATHNNQGRIELRRGSELEVRGLISNESSGRISVDGGTLRFADALENSGQLLVGFGGATVHGHIDNDFGGKIIVSGASQATFFDLVDLGSGSELRVAGGSQALFFGEVVRRAGSLLTGTGTKFFEGGLTVPGSSGSAALRDEGSAVFGDGGTVAFELDAAGGAERLQVAGSLGFGGVLRLASSGSFVAQVGQRFDLFGWGSASGSFSSIDTSGLLLAGDAVLDFSRLYVDGSVSVTAVPEPGTWATLLAGLAVLGGLQRRRRA